MRLQPKSGSWQTYEEQLPCFVEFVAEAVPAEGTVLVVSKGDQRLLAGPAAAWHFPQAGQGVYAGAYPPDSEAAIAHLEDLRNRGAGYLAFPAVSLWWLDHYEGLREHLARHYRVVAENPAIGVVYALAGEGGSRTPPPSVEGNRSAPPEGLVALRSLRLPQRNGPASRRLAERTHRLRALDSLFTSRRAASGGGKLIRVCLVDTILQTGGAEWFATQLALRAHPGVFEFVVVAFNTDGSALAGRLREQGLTVIDSTAWSEGDLGFDEWKERALFELLDSLRPDMLFFSSQYLFEALPADRLARYPTVVRISNFHADALGSTDFSAAARVICTTQEQLQAMPERHLPKASVISTGVDTQAFRPLAPGDKEALKDRLGLAGKTLVLLVARLGDPLKRTDVFQDVVRKVNRAREDVTFVVVGYFETHNESFEAEFRRFAEEEGVVWREGVSPWETPAVYGAADFLLSVSAAHEGLSNTVLQALASGVVPVVTASAGMRDLVAHGRTGYLVEEGDAAAIAAQLLEAVDAEPATRRQVSEEGRGLVEGDYRLDHSAEAYQRAFLELFRAQPANVCITDGYFSAGGAEWLAAQLILNSDPEKLRFDLVLHRTGSPLAGWLQERGVTAHEASTAASYTDWLTEGMGETFQAVRPDVVMPCTITTWPRHNPFYRLLVISQNASDAGVLREADYEQADHILCVSEDVRSQLSARHHWKMTVLHNSIDVEMFRSTPEPRARVRKELGIPEDAHVVLWCGRMHEARKRLDVLMELIESMSGHPGLHFLVVGYFRPGEGDQKGWSDLMRRQPNISWVEGVTPWETPGYYAAGDTYLSTSGFRRSDFEGLSLTTVQALAAGLPVVTTMSGGQQEAVEEGVNGWLVEPGDVEALAAALRRAVGEDPGVLEAIRRRNREKALAAFDIRRHARLYTGIARLLRNTVGPALAVDAELPATPPVPYTDEDEAGELEKRGASSFLRYTWPMLLAADGVEPALVLAADEPLTPGSLEAAALQLTPGDWLSVARIGGDHDSEGGPPLEAGRIAALLEYLQRAFPSWNACGRRGPDLLLEKR